ncbi:hypothetical protein ACFOVS_23660 [Rhizobium lemnae]|uniref:Uncharacterized protein n=1 Tax=Rhizobium lemnae TaxID=1214924 RepID=A0ABV8EHV6_9HYPH
MTDAFSSASSAEFIQASRVLRIVSPLGEDQLLPERVAIEEGVNRLFEMAKSSTPFVRG